MKAVTIGLIGMGFHARTVHVPGYDLVGELRFCAVATSRSETAVAASERYRVRGYGDYRELLKDDGVEAVAICTPADKFAEVCRAALSAGKHVLMETPGIQDAATAGELMDLAKKKGLVVQVGYLNRWSPLFGVLKEKMAVYKGPRILTFEYYPWLHHTYDLALYLCGPLERVVAATRDAAGSTATLRFKNGDTAVVVGRSLLNCSINIETVRVSSKEFYAVVEGRRRVRVVEHMKPTGVEEWGVPASEDTGYEPHAFASRYLELSGTCAMLRAFARAVREGSEVRCGLAESAATGAMMREIEGKF